MTSYRTRFLVTGGAGFIGSHLSETLLENGHRVVALDNLQTGSQLNIQHLLGHPDFLFVKGSVLDERALARWMGRCDFAIHLAAAVGVRYILEHPLESLAVNIAGTERLLDQAARLRRPVFIASSSEVYGKQSGQALRETDDLRIGSTSVFRWSYACSKALDEFMALAYARSHGLRVIVGRLFNTVGPRQVGTYGMVVPRFVEQALAGEPLVIYGDGTQSRTFTHVKDAVEVIYRLVMSPAAWGQVFNIAGSETVSINKLARRILEMTGSSSPLQHLPPQEVYGPDFEDIERRVPCLDKLRETLGFLPSRGLDEILRDVIAAKLPTFSREEPGFEPVARGARAGEGSHPILRAIPPVSPAPVSP